LSVDAENEHWRSWCEQAAREQDLERRIELVREINRRLIEGLLKEKGSPKSDSLSQIANTSFREVAAFPPKCADPWSARLGVWLCQVLVLATPAARHLFRAGLLNEPAALGQKKCAISTRMALCKSVTRQKSTAGE